MPTYFFISIVVVILLGVALLWKSDFLRDSLDDTLDVVLLFVFFLTLGIGLILTPLLRTYKTEYIELTNYKILKNEHSLVIDLSQSPEVNEDYFYDIQKVNIFHDHELVETSADSIKFFLEKQKNFYSITMDKQIVWSKYPYNTYNHEE